MQGQSLLTIHSTMRYLTCLSTMDFLLLGQNVMRKALVFQAFSLPVSDTIVDHSNVIRQENQCVRRGRYCQCGLHRSFSSACYWRSKKINVSWLSVFEFGERLF